mmetsp:Transcript_1351/g.3984  ORF Transcript_1351/g.3984 Transcript_1351/m.3984 type:complete len:403 (-) Transcript_1351:631-1839(-)
MPTPLTRSPPIGASTSCFAPDSLPVAPSSPSNSLCCPRPSRRQGSMLSNALFTTSASTAAGPRSISATSCGPAFAPCTLASARPRSRSLVCNMIPVWMSIARSRLPSGSCVACRNSSSIAPFSDVSGRRSSFAAASAAASAAVSVEAGGGVWVGVGGVGSGGGGGVGSVASAPAVGTAVGGAGAGGALEGRAAAGVVALAATSSTPDASKRAVSARAPTPAISAPSRSHASLASLAVRWKRGSRTGTATCSDTSTSSCRLRRSARSNDPDRSRHGGSLLAGGVWSAPVPPPASALEASAPPTWPRLRSSSGGKESMARYMSPVERAVVTAGDTSPWNTSNPAPEESSVNENMPPNQPEETRDALSCSCTASSSASTPSSAHATAHASWSECTSSDPMKGGMR